MLAESLADLDRSRRELGGRLVLRAGDPLTQVCRLADEVDAATVHIAVDCSRYARRRQAATAPLRSPELARSRATRSMASANRDAYRAR